MKRKIIKSSGNVFVDLGFDPSKAAVLRMRSNLMSDLRLYIEKHKLTQSEAAKRLGIARTQKVERRKAESMNRVRLMRWDGSTGAL